MSETTQQKTQKKWGVYYIGAPHGIGEIGELVSRHKTEEEAVIERSRLQKNPRYYGENSQVRRIKD